MIYISMFTNDVVYSTHVKILIKCLEKFELKSKIYEIENRGSWIKNTSQKAEIILRAMEDFPDENIVWIDADAEIYEKPVLFDKLKCDLAFYFWHEKKELRSGTLFIRNNYEMKLFILNWIKLNNSNDIWEQRNLQTIIDSNIKTTNLPVEYCFIFDSKYDKELLKGSPVIVHNQASRKAKVILYSGNKIIIDEIPKVRLVGNFKIKTGQGG